MADPLSFAASILAVASAAAVTIRSLCDTIKSFKNRDKTLHRLQVQLQDFVTILDSLAQIANPDAAILTLLEGPINRCKETCADFEKSMQRFHGKSKTTLLDWTKMEFMKGDINNFIETIEGYKSTVTVGLGVVNLRNSKISHEVLVQYEEMIKDTAYNLEVHLLQIDEKLTRLDSRDVSASDTSIDLKDERAVTEQCLRVCKRASSYIESLAAEEATLLHDLEEDKINDETQDAFEAQMLLCQAFKNTQNNFLGVIDRLGQRLQGVVENKDSGDKDERLRLQEDISMSKQCLDVCQMASEISRQKVYRVGEAVAEGDSDQLVVTTLSDLFDVKKALSKDHSAQLVASLTPENFEQVVEKRYSSRFGALAKSSDYQQVGGLTSQPNTNSQGNGQYVAPATSKSPELHGREARRGKPNPNEMKKRRGEKEDE